MACQKNGNKVNQTAGLKAGIGAVAGQASRVAGNLAGRLARAADPVTGAVGQRVAPISNRLLQAVDRPTTVAANLVPALATAAVYAQVKVGVTGPAQGRRPAVALAVGLRDRADIAGRAKAMNTIKRGVGTVALAGQAVTALTRAVSQQPGSSRKLVKSQKGFLLGQQKVEVTLAKSKLTGLLNRGDRLLSAGNVVSSEGDLVSHQGAVWHRGTTVVRTSQGERTITHLRKMGLPATSHYFERVLSDIETASIVSGQSQPHKLAGHVGTVGAMENLAPSWAQAKRTMILTRLHWPTPETSAIEGWVTAAGQRVRQTDQKTSRESRPGVEGRQKEKVTR